MQRARLSWIPSPTRVAVLIGLIGMVATGCAEGDATSTSGPELGASSSGDADSSGTSPTGPTTADSVGTGNGSSTGSADETSTTDAPADTSTGGCPAGTEGCPCSSGSCEGDLLCLGDVCQTAQCDGDLFEPNEDEANAFDLGMINDNDSDGGIISGSLHHPGDVDWYRYQGDDDITGNVDPARDVVASAGLRLCKFLECDNGLPETEFECPAGTEYALSPSARAGCCASDGVALPDLNCTGVIEDNAAVYIRVDMPEEACVTYSVSYHY